MEDIYFKKIMTTIILIILLVLSFFLLRPLLLSIIMGLILAFILTPLYCVVKKIVKSGNLSALIICLLLILLIVLPFWFLTPVVIDQSIKVFTVSQNIDFIQILKDTFPSIFASEDFSGEIGLMIRSFVTEATNRLMNYLGGFILNFPTLFLQSLVVFFTLFFVLRDREAMASYFRSLSPFSRDIEKKLFDSSKAITRAVIYGQVIIGILQGILVGVGFFILGIPNALLLTVLSSFAGIFPVIGTAIIWVPVAIYLFISGNSFAAFGIIIFGVASSLLDNFLRPIIVSKRAHMDSLLILLGMIGGIFLFGVLGFILGPLILAYLIIILELYRNKEVSNVFIKEQKKLS